MQEHPNIIVASQDRPILSSCRHVVRRIWSILCFASPIGSISSGKTRLMNVPEG